MSTLVRGPETVKIAAQPSQPQRRTDLCWKYWTLLQEHRPEPVASESIVFLSEKTMEHSTSRSLFYDLADGES